MRFGLFGSAAARRGGGEFDSAEGYRDFIEYNVEAEALGFHGTFVVEHHFTGFGQVWPRSTCSPGSAPARGRCGWVPR